jgi:hypothetical protein
METFKLPETELAEMKQFYLEEYDKTSKRLIHIMAILKRLGVESPEQETGRAIAWKPSPGKAASAEQGISKPRKKSGRKSKWELLIMKRLRQLDKPVTYDELTDEIMAFSKLPAEKRTSTKQAVVNVIFRLRSRDKKLDTFSVGTREKYIALKSWFATPGVIKKEYAAKIKNSKPASKRKMGKVERPRKTAGK